MTDQDNLLQLKKLPAKIIGGGSTEDDIEANTIAEPIGIIQQHYTSGGAGLTIASAEINVDGAGNFDNGLITMSDGSTVDIVIAQIGKLTLTSEEGHAISKTIITVSPSCAEENHYMYKIGKIVAPAKNHDLSDWTFWNGTYEITADGGSILNVAECTENNRAVACGSVEIIAPLF